MNYVIANLFNQKQLSYNKSQYEKYGLKKSVLLPVSSEDFKRVKEEEPWLDKGFSSDLLEEKLSASGFDEEVKNQIRSFPENGFIILKNFLSDSEADQIDVELNHLIDSGESDYNFTGRKVMFAFEKSEYIGDIVKKKKLMDILEFVLNKKVIPFQTINFTEPSEQKAHSDTIHMTTHPLGNMMAAWFALEDIGVDQGPIFYCPKSHKLPYVLNGTYDHGGNKMRIGENAYGKFEEKIEQQVKDHHLEKIPFVANKGDLFIWHANLIHGGSPWKDKSKTRKSMVCHYFAEDVICYHELTQRPAFIKSV